MNTEGEPEKFPPHRRPRTVLVYLIALVGGLAGVGAAAVEEWRYGTMYLPVFVLIGPAIEEVCKPIGLIFLLEKRPHWVRSSGHLVAGAILGALTFATVENLLYIRFHHPEPTSHFVLYRFTVCTAVHVLASGVFGIGLAKMWKHIRAFGGRFDIDVCFKYYAAAVAIHSTYNITVFILHQTGLLQF